MENQEQIIGTIGEYQDELYRDIYEACELARHDDHVIASMGRVWVKAIIQARCSETGITDPFKSQSGEHG